MAPSDITSFQWTEVTFSSKFKKVEKYAGIFFPLFIFILATTVGLLVHPTRPLLGAIIGGVGACLLAMGYWLYRYLYSPIKFAYTKEGIFYILKNGKQGSINWDRVHSIQQLPRYPDYYLYYHRKAKLYEVSNKGMKIDTLPLGIQPGSVLQEYWYTTLKRKEKLSEEEAKND